MRIVLPRISARRDNMDLWIVFSKKQLFTHFRNVSAVLAAIAFRTSAFHRLARCTFQQVLVLYTPAPLPSKSQVISPSPYLWWHSWYGARYSYFTTITPTCLCNYRLYRTSWCRGDTSVIPWPGYSLNNWGSSPPCISFRTLCASTLARVVSEFRGCVTWCSTAAATYYQPSAEFANGVELYNHCCILFRGVLDEVTVSRWLVMCNHTHIAHPCYRHVIFYCLHYYLRFGCSSRSSVAQQVRSDGNAAGLYLGVPSILTQMFVDSQSA